MTASTSAEDNTSRFNRLHALRHFAEFEGRTQSQLHIRPLHEYVTCRLVLEGGFQPTELSPRPPLRVEQAETRTSSATTRKQQPSPKPRFSAD